MLSAALAGFLGTALAGLRVPAFGMTFGALNIIFTGVGLLAISAGIYVIITLRRVHLDEDAKTETEAVEVSAW